jgi:phenylacetate-CoA ligase
MSDADVAAFARQMASYRPKLIFGHAHSLAQLAAAIRDGKLPRTRPVAIISTAMVLHDYQRELIEGVFDCRVTNRYGCEEVSLIACECPAHAGLHVNDESVVVELLDRTSDQPVAAGTPGRVVVTDLANYAMPLLRYEVGDIATWSSHSCACGRQSAMLQSVAGREADYVVTRSGHFVSGISLTEQFSRLVPQIAQLQIVQESLDQFCFRIVGEESKHSEARIATLVQELFGTTAQFRCEYLAAIPQQTSGKYRFCISHVAASAERRAA